MIGSVVKLRPAFFLPLSRNFSQSQDSEIHLLDRQLTEKYRKEFLFNTKLPEGKLVMLGQAQSYSLLHIYGMGAIAGSYLTWGLAFGVLSFTEIFISMGGLAAAAIISSRERRFNKEDKVFAIVKQASGSYSIGVLIGRQMKPQYIEASKQDIKINQQWTKPQLGIKMKVKDRTMNIPVDFKVDQRLWKQLI